MRFKGYFVIMLIILSTPFLLKANTKITAGYLINHLDSLALTLANDAKLILVKSNSVDTTGKAETWYYVYNSLDSLKEYHFSINNCVVNYDTFKASRVGIGILDPNWIDSDSAICIAEISGGYHFRMTHPNSHIEAKLCRYVVPPFYNHWIIEYIDNSESFYIKVNALNGEILTSVKHEKEKDYHPDYFLLFQNYPNPFNPQTTIKFRVEKPSFVELSLYNSRGQKIYTIFSGKVQKGIYQKIVYADNLASGVYYYKMNVGNSSIVKKCLVLK